MLAGLSLLSLAGTVAAYFKLPPTIPLHWNGSGLVDAWGGKANILWLGALPLVLVVVLAVIPRIDPRRESWSRHAKAYTALKVLVVLTLVACSWITVAAGLGATVDVGALVRVFVAILFVGLGNYVGMIRPNYFFGIRTPWTLANEEVWRLTHRRGAVVFIILGLAYAASLLIPPGPALEVFAIAAPVGASVYVCAYSWWLWRKLGRKAPPGAG
jgi:uncharacterized membrane protein